MPEQDPQNAWQRCSRLLADYSCPILSGLFGFGLAVGFSWYMNTHDTNSLAQTNARAITELTATMTRQTERLAETNTMLAVIQARLDSVTQQGK